ncbi:MAG: hypothetical protein WB661_02035 [Candidatus Bathyarchaeia archaeon]
MSVTTKGMEIASTIITQSLERPVPKLTVRPDSVLVTLPYSAAAPPSVPATWNLIRLRVVEGDVFMEPAFSVVVSLLPSSPIIMSPGTFEVDTPVTVGAPVTVEVATAGRLALGSNGQSVPGHVPVFAPDTPNTITSPTSSLARLPLNVTVIEVTVELATAYHSAIQAWPEPPLWVFLLVQVWLEVLEILFTVLGEELPCVLLSTIITSPDAQLKPGLLVVLTITCVPLEPVLYPVQVVSSANPAAYTGIMGCVKLPIIFCISCGVVRIM